MNTSMTITEKILAKAANKKEVHAGEIIEVNIDWCMTNDVTTYISIDLFNNKIKNKIVKNPKKTIFVIDHNVPSESVNTTHNQNIMRRFAKEHGIILHDGEGIEHQLLIEKYILPGEIIVGADSHTCSYGALGAFGSGFGCTDFVTAMATGITWLMVPQTLKFELQGRLKEYVYPRDLILKIIGDIGCEGATYKTMEFGGSAIKDFSINDRMVLCNLTVEAGAKNGIVGSDKVTQSFLETVRGTSEGYYPIQSDSECTYEQVYEYDLATIEPAVVGPHFVDRYETVSSIQKIKITQGFIGSCNSGRIDEMRTAAAILKNNKIQSNIKLLISPASKAVYLQALKEGLIEIFLKSGAIVLNPNCSVCWGGCQGVISDNDVLISTGTRNFKGRSGSGNALIFLGSAATVAASCLIGEITDPRELK